MTRWRPRVGNRPTIGRDEHERDRPRFHLVFMPGSTRELALFTMTLLAWSHGCDFVLVDNACLPPERRFLRGLAEQRPRLEYVQLPGAEPVAHRVALDYLVKLEHRDSFCFMDTDILADGDWLEPLVAAATTHAGVFACPPMWTEPEDQIHPSHWRRLGGRYHVTDTGMVVGSTYLAIYDIGPLRQVLDSGATFGRARWENLTPPVQGQLERIGMRKDAYDTAKVVNLLLVAGGHELIHLDAPGLHHIGGISVVAHPSADLDERRVAKLESVSDDERESIENRLGRRGVTAEYVGAILRHLFSGSALPEPPRSGDDSLDARLALMAESIRAAHDRHGNELAALPS